MKKPETIETHQADVDSPDVVSGEIESRGIESRDAAASAVEGPRDVRLTLTVTVLVCAIAAVVWISAVARSTGRGFDISDEGYYLLSYRWWSTHFRNFTGAQYLYGPVFQAVGYSIAGLRIFRLFTQVAVHGVFAFTFMRWLRERRPSAPPTYLWELAGGTGILASAGVAYSWLPLSPGYNDVSLLGALLTVAVVLRAATYADRGMPVPRWVPLSFGPVIVCSVFAKWTSSAVTVAVAGLTLAVVLAPRGLREIARFTAWTLASIAATVAVIHVLVVPLGTALPPMIGVNKALTSHGNSVGPLLDLYWTTARDLAKRIAERNVVLVLAAVIAVASRRPVWQSCASLVAIAGFASAYAELEAHQGTTGGTANLSEFPAGPIATVALAVFIGLLVLVAERLTPVLSRLQGVKSVERPTISSVSRDGYRGLAVLLMLAVAPVTQGLGTGNPLYFAAINGFAVWMAIIIAILTGIEAAPSVARWMTMAVAAAAIFLSASIGRSGVRSFPYRTAGHDQATAVAGGVAALGSLRLSPGDAANFSHLRSMLKRHVEPAGRAIMAFDESAGIVLALDGQPVGEAWYSSSDADRTRAGIKSECQNKKPFWGSRVPLILFRRIVTSADIEAFKFCGLDLATDYRLLAPAHETMGFMVYVPVSDEPREAK
jgi:hypothetical protein